MNELVHTFLVNERIRMISGLAVGITKEQAIKQAYIFLSNIDSDTACCLAEKMFYSITSDEIALAKRVLCAIK